MSWNYRLIRNRTLHNGELIYSYVIHEVYYDENFKPNAWTKDAITLAGFEDFSDAFQSFELMKKAFEKPVLEVLEDSNGNEYLNEVPIFEQSNISK